MSADWNALELAACVPAPVHRDGFNPQADIPYGCAVEHIHQAMVDFTLFLQAINQHLHTKEMIQLESLLMPANFSSVVSEFMNVTIPKYCRTLTKNVYHNGHPDLIPAGRYPNDAVQYAHEGIEVKASRYFRG